MFQAIKNFPQQLAYQPIIQNRKYFKPAKQFIVLGMGGSHLAADILKMFPVGDLIVHKNYSLPNLPWLELKKYLIIANSYSGNTEEILDGLHEAYKNKLNVVCVSVGGKLIEFAKTHNLPYVQMPDTDIQPRMALGFNVRALLKIMGNKEFYKQLDDLAVRFKPQTYEKQGKKLAKILKNKIPIIYSSEQNKALAYNWKIKFNETGKIPAFFNILPELNHNEMTGFDTHETTRHLSDKFAFVFLTDECDHAHTKKRFKVLAKLLRAKKLPVIFMPIKGKFLWEMIFSSLVTADWTAYYLAKGYSIDPEPVPMVEKFKKLTQ